MVPPADPPAPMAAGAQSDDAKPLPVAAEEPAAADPAVEEPAAAAAVVAEEELEKNQVDPKAAPPEKGEGKEKGAAVQRSSSFKEESNFLSDLKDHERKALVELRALVDEAVRENRLFPAEKESKEGEKSAENGNAGAEKEKEEGRADEHAKDAPLEEGESKGEAEKEEVSKDEAEKKEEVKSEEHTEEVAEKEEEVKSEEHTKEEAEKEEASEEKVKLEEHTKEKAEKKEESEEKVKLEEHTKEVAEKKEEAKSEEQTKEVAEKERDISLWGVPLLGSEGSQGTDVILLKFLRAREFRAKEAFEMLRSTLQWRKDARIDSILEESLGEGLEAAAYMDGADREGHPVCYNIYGAFQDSALYEKAFGTEEKVELFLRWRFQLMEKGIQKLDLRPGGVASILQITDLKDSPGISKREIRAAMKRAVGLLQDNYPEFVANNIFINVPFWYYAFNSLLSPFLTQRTKSKFVFARPARVIETLLKYIPAEDISVRYGGLKRENDTEFSVEDGGVFELFIKSGATENVEIPIPEAGSTVVWDLTVVGWEVNYKEEFVPTDEASYTILLQKGKKMGSQEQAVRNSFRNNEPGKVVLIIENNTFWKKKVLYRYKTKSSS